MPEFKYPSQTDATDQDWPELVITEDLIRVGATTTAEVGDTEAAVERLEARAKRLRAKARALGPTALN